MKTDYRELQLQLQSNAYSIRDRFIKEYKLNGAQLKKIRVTLCTDEERIILYTTIGFCNYSTNLILCGYRADNEDFDGRGIREEITIDRIKNIEII
ncbi:MAG: hypothetical protein ACRDDZ_05920 [Marinifilaceae bacterium]